MDADEFDQRTDDLFRRLAAAPLVPEAELERYVKTARVPLNRSQLDVLRWYSFGLDARMIASLEHLTYDQVHERTRAARYKLRAKNTTHAVALALRAGLIT